MPFKVTIDGKDEITVDDSDGNKLGGGGQGNVYRVKYHGKTYALKWYTAKTIIQMKDFKNNLRRNTKSESPDECFVWPQHFAENDQSYGYLMDIIDTDRFTLFSNIYVGRKRIRDKNGKKKTIDVEFESEGARVNAAINLTKAFRSLQRKGMAYLDLNDGGFYMDTKTGEVLICDCDNIGPSNNDDVKLVLGTYGYRAPELVEGDGMPNMDTDKHSLAVLLFMLLTWSKPFDGKMMAGSMVSQSSESKFYGRSAVFMFDPKNPDNRPIPENKNAINFWPTLTPAVQDLFIQCFGEGLNKPTKRPTASKWTNALNSMRAGLISCSCGIGDRFVKDNEMKGSKYECPKCKKQYSVLSIGDDRYPLKRGKEIYALSIGANSFDRVIGRVAGKTNSKGKVMLGLLNDSNMDWKVVRDKEEYTVNPGRGFELKQRMEITFVYKEMIGRDEIISKKTGKVN